MCEAGINGYGRARNGLVARFHALGATTGDWGGGPAIGLGAAVRARDGRGQRTVLEQSIAAHFGVSRPSAVAAAIDTGRIPDERLKELAPLIFQAAADGDKVSLEIVDRQSEELAIMAGALAKRLGLMRQEVDVVLIGGVFKGYDPDFLPGLSATIRSRVPGTSVNRVRVPSVFGAALKGLDRLAGGLVSEDAESRLREQLAA